MMKKEDFLYLSIFISLLGFLIFIATVINKSIGFSALLNEFYVLFLFFGILILILGIVLMLVWHVENRLPFQDEVKVKRHFPAYLGLGIMLIATGFVMIFHYSITDRTLYIIAMSFSISGILLMLQGLRYFIKEVIKIKPITGKMQQHS